MNSVCPSCKKSMEHEDYLFEVQCSCGMRFNPFFDANVVVSTTEPEAEPEPEPEFKEAPIGSLVADDPTLNADDFSESAQAFKDIVEFGETLSEPSAKAPSPPSEPTLSEPAADLESAATPSFPPPATGEVPTGGALMTAGDAFQGYEIEAYLTPVSVWSPLDAESSNPLGNGYLSLWKKGVAAGGNAILAIKWSFSPDGTKVLLTGTPVRCAKRS